MRFFILAGILLSALTSPAQTKSTPDIRRLMNLVKKERVVHFKLTEIYDPYQGGQRMAQRSVGSRYLSLSANQQFALHYDSEKQVGKWHIEGHDLNFHLRGQTTRGGGSSTAKMELVAFRGKRLSLRRQGRHGYITYVYYLIKEDKPQS